MGDHAPRGARLIVVGGPERAGTTLVQRILNAHPDVTGPPELNVFSPIARGYRSITSPGELARLDPFISAERIDDAFGLMIEELLYPLADDAGSRFLSEKTPRNVVHFDVLVRMLPGARFVLVVRDPRDIVASLLAVGARASTADGDVYAPAYTRSTTAAAREVLRCLEAGRRALAAHPDRIHLVRYEELVTEPEATIGALMDFLSLADAEGLTAPTAHLDDTHLDGVWYDTERYHRDIDPSSVGRWRASLSKRDLLIVAALCGDVSRAFGYDGIGGGARASVVRRALGVWSRAGHLLRRP